MNLLNILVVIIKAYIRVLQPVRAEIYNSRNHYTGVILNDIRSGDV